MTEGAFPWDVFDPLDLDMPRIVVDTREGYRPGLDEVARFCQWTSEAPSSAGG